MHYEIVYERFGSIIFAFKGPLALLDYQTKYFDLVLGVLFIKRNLSPKLWYLCHKD